MKKILSTLFFLGIVSSVSGQELIVRTFDSSYQNEIRIDTFMLGDLIILGHANKGKNAANVVSVDEIIGNAISLTPFLVAVSKVYPELYNRYTFSTTTIALSTNIPRARINA